MTNQSDSQKDFEIVNGILLAGIQQREKTRKKIYSAISSGEDPTKYFDKIQSIQEKAEDANSLSLLTYQNLIRKPKK